MNLQITCRGIEHTKELDTHIRKQLHKVEAFVDKHRDPHTILVVIEGHPSHAHNSVTCRVHVANYEAYGSREGQNIYALIDEVMDIVYGELRKNKEWQVDHQKNKNGHRPG